LSWLRGVRFNRPGCDHSFTSGAVEQLPSCIGMTGMAGGLVDQMEKYPSEITAVTPLAKCTERRKRPYSRVGRCRPFPIGDQRSSNGQRGVRVKFAFTPFDLQAVHSPLNPSPLDVRQMVHDADQGDQPTFWRPACTVVVQSIRLSNDGGPQVVEPTKEQLPFVTVAGGNPQLFVGWHPLIVGTAGRRLDRRRHRPRIGPKGLRRGQAGPNESSGPTSRETSAWTWNTDDWVSLGCR